MTNTQQQTQLQHRARGPLTKGPPCLCPKGAHLPLTKGQMGKKPCRPVVDCKGKALRSGTVSHKRRLLFQQRGMERELKAMETEDILSSQVHWDLVQNRANTKAKKMTKEEINKMMG